MASADDALAALRANYAKKIPDKLTELDTAAEGLAPGANTTPLKAVRGLVHKLAGSAPSFGFSELGDAARVAERLCSDVLATGAVTDAAIVAIREKINVLKDRAAAGAPERAAGANGKASDEPLSGRVLVVEDEPSQALFVQVILKKAGLDVTLEPDPKKVADRLGEVRPDLVFMDMNMPEMNGDQVAVQIRARTDDLAGVAIVFLSGEEDPVRRDAAMATGANGFVAKPVQPTALMETARRFLKSGD